MPWPVTCCACGNKWFTGKKTYLVICPVCMETVPNNSDAAVHRKLSGHVVRRCEIGFD